KPTQVVHSRFIIDSSGIKLRDDSDGSQLYWADISSVSFSADYDFVYKATDNLGNAVKSGYYEIQFRIWNDATKNETANYIWGRTFPLHVVTNGMFNVLLTNDGDVPGSPAVNSILEAFAGTDRYLGLTITRNPDGAVTSPVEISPRQKLATAPYAIHAHQATWADHATTADNATQAASASSALKADNATKFDNMSTSDFLMVKQTSQTLAGSLTITNGALTVRGQTTVSDTFHAAAASVFDGSMIANGSLSVAGNVLGSSQVTATGMLNANGGLKVTGNVRFGTDAPIIIRRFHLEDQPSGAIEKWYNTGYSTTTWSAVLVGFNCTGDYWESGTSSLLQMMLYPNGSGGTTWRILYTVRHHSDPLSAIYVDVMFIRKELTADDRPTLHYLPMENP
ncbi:MAG TPA: hypothetical protein PKM43_08820, partial [Verrucomicrobiota bacterium]|nr:hypothetical protein [Verrucomicrobiota bacterium]